MPAGWIPTGQVEILLRASGGGFVTRAFLRKPIRPDTQPPYAGQRPRWERRPESRSACHARKPVVFGPNMQNFADVVRILLAGGGMIRVQSAAESGSHIRRSSWQPGAPAGVEHSSQRIVRGNQGDRAEAGRLDRAQTRPPGLAPVPLPKTGSNPPNPGFACLQEREDARRNSSPAPAH